MPITSAQAAEEVIRRREACESLTRFAEYVLPYYKADRIHEVIADALQAAIDNTGPRQLLIHMPPQFGKSTLISQMFPVYWFGHNPDLPVVLATYGASLAEFHSRKSRELMQSARYANLFPEARVSKEAHANDYWEIAEHRGYMVAAGIGGPIGGKGAFVGIIDDPFKDWAEAQSKTMRDAAWNWYNSVFHERVWEGGIIIVLMTRWNEDDLVGRLVNSEPDKWRVIRGAALAEPQQERDKNNRLWGLPDGLDDVLHREVDEPLCPQRYSQKYLFDVRERLLKNSPIMWWALYQGAPSAPEGIEFKREWFENRVPRAPVCTHYVRYWDKAGTEGGGKRTAGVLLGFYPEVKPDDPFKFGGTVYAIDVVKGQWAAYERERKIKETAELDRLLYGSVEIWIEQEPADAGKESALATIANLAEYNVQAETARGDKAERATPFQVQLRVGNVFLVAAEWNDDYVDEFVKAWSGNFTDQIDATSGAFNRLKKSDGRSKPVVSGKRPILVSAAKELPPARIDVAIKQRDADADAARRYVGNRYVVR